MGARRGGQASRASRDGAEGPPLAGAVVLRPTVFEYGYDLIGGAYPK